MAGKADSFVVAKGVQRTIEYARRKDGSIPAKQFYNSLPKCDQAKMTALWQRTANHGEIPQPRKFKHEEGPIFAFKTKAADGRMIRFGCVRLGKRWLLVHGFYKPAQSRWPQSDVNQCYTVRNEHVATWEKSSST